MFYFFNVDLKSFNIYILSSQEKKIIFSMWDLKPFNIYTIYSQKKVIFFQCGIKKIFGLNTSI
jgi:hypothetical protein